MFCDKDYIYTSKVTCDYQLHSSVWLSSDDHYKYLGVVLQSNLQWSEAIIARANAMMHCNIKKELTSVKEQIYKTLIRPQQEYASSAWSKWLKQDIMEVEKV